MTNRLSFLALRQPSRWAEIENQTGKGTNIWAHTYYLGKFSFLPRMVTVCEGKVGRGKVGWGGWSGALREVTTLAPPADVTNDVTDYPLRIVVAIR